MSSRILYIGHRFAESPPLQAKVDHIFGGVLSYEDGELRTAGVDYGASYGFAVRDELLEKRTDQLFLLPISDQAFQRFRTLAKSLHTLSLYNRLPYYFSLSLQYCAAVEGVDPPEILNIDGDIEDPETVGLNKFGPLDAFGQFFDNEEHRVPIYDDICYARANCFSMFNFVAKTSGIDLAALDIEGKEWDFTRGGTPLFESLDKRFLSAASPLKIDGVSFSQAESQQKSVWNLKGSQGDKRLSVGDYLNAAFSFAQGRDKFFDYFAKQKPFERTPAEIPFNLEEQIRRFPHLEAL